MRYIIFLLCFAVLLVGCKEDKVEPKQEAPVISAPVENKPVIEGTTPPVSNVKPPIHVKPIPGGYMKQDPATEEMQSVAKYVLLAIQQKSPEASLVKVHEAATQVVAGMNFFVRLEVNEKGTNAMYDAIVYQDLQGNKSVSKLEKLQ